MKHMLTIRLLVITFGKRQINAVKVLRKETIKNNLWSASHDR